MSQRMLGDPQDILSEVNTSGETSKSGVGPEAVLATAEAISGLANLRLRGLMTVGPLSANPDKVRDAFKALKESFEQCRAEEWAARFDILSMGMSGDYETAIEEGSTLVRIGSALFGARR